ncbi:SMI1/KNR4 family protein [Streptomyces sp. NPDC050516]|uniref:SMI1/KNR4 family protein n=1 Tax=Streptomyces sp. NPDC050516 TaxID=3365621 RepID=UPI0037875636
MTEDIAARQVTEAWHRIEEWLREHAPASHAALLPGAGGAEICAVEEVYGMRMPEDLRTLWKLTGGGAGCFFGDYDLTSFGRGMEFYQGQMRFQQKEGGNDANGIPWWRPNWIPVFSNSRDSQAFVKYLDCESGLLYSWDRYGMNNYGTEKEELDSIGTYLEEVADALEFPALAVRDRPGLIDGYLVWGSGAHVHPDTWRPFMA